MSDDVEKTITWNLESMELGELIHDYWHAPEQFYQDGENSTRDEWWNVSQELDWVTGVPIEKDIVCASGKVYNLNECADWNWAKEFIDKAIETSVSNTGFSKSKEENEHNKTHLKKLIPDDAKSVTYNGITASRNKNGIVSIRIKQEQPMDKQEAWAKIQKLCPDIEPNDKLAWQLKQNKQWTKNDILKEYFKLIPDFQHKETGKYLDAKM